MFDLRLDGKTAIVTGAAFNLGRTFAEALARQGASVVVADLNTDGANDVANSIRASGYIAAAVEVDVTSEESVSSMVEQAISLFGGVDILVNNAGWRALPAGGVNEDILGDFQTSEQWQRVMQVNVIGPLMCSRACRSSMASRGGGVVVNLTSVGAYERPEGAYGVSKLACSGLTISLATELGPDNIRVNGIAPGMMTQRMPDATFANQYIEGQVIKRRGQPNDLIGPLLFLVSDMAGFVTGVNLLVDGGRVRRI